MSSKVIHETVMKGSYEFEITKFSLAKEIGVGKAYTSNKFTVGGSEWVIEFYPDGYNQANKEYVSVFLKLESSSIGDDVRALFVLKSLDQTGKVFHGYHLVSPRTFNTTSSPSWGYDHYMKRSDLESHLSKKGDNFSIFCTITVVKTRVEIGKAREDWEHNVIPVPPNEESSSTKGTWARKLGWCI